ncbi:hypothetical protein Acr_00g0000560 [Actinidia rufa]|uniref:Uncharacterized protein n=1 Tax=Actinidia rufa TaxID=165716 RepID=A0A7J0D6C3_9ERIC|nr:hypothetical protein Acr_00g0000560 [Actinidia rufa]
MTEPSLPIAATPEGKTSFLSSKSWLMYNFNASLIIDANSGMLRGSHDPSGRAVRIKEFLIWESTCSVQCPGSAIGKGLGKKASWNSEPRGRGSQTSVRSLLGTDSHLWERQMGHSRRLVWNNKPFPLVNEPSFADFLKRKKKEASYCLSPSGSPSTCASEPSELGPSEATERKGRPTDKTDRLAGRTATHPTTGQAGDRAERGRATRVKAREVEASRVTSVELRKERDSVEEMELVKVTSGSLNRGRMPHEVTGDVKEDVVEVPKQLLSSLVTMPEGSQACPQVSSISSFLCLLPVLDLLLALVNTGTPAMKVTQSNLLELRPFYIYIKAFPVRKEVS